MYTGRVEGYKTMLWNSSKVARLNSFPMNSAVSREALTSLELSEGNLIAAFDEFSREEVCDTFRVRHSVRSGKRPRVSLNK